MNNSRVIVLNMFNKRTAHTMQLEDQANSKKRIEAAINERTEELKKEVPKMLWD